MICIFFQIGRIKHKIEQTKCGENWRRAHIAKQLLFRLRILGYNACFVRSVVQMSEVVYTPFGATTFAIILQFFVIVTFL